MGAATGVPSAPAGACCGGGAASAGGVSGAGAAAAATGAETGAAPRAEISEAPVAVPVFDLADAGFLEQRREPADGFLVDGKAAHGASPSARQRSCRASSASRYPTGPKPAIMPSAAPDM